MIHPSYSELIDIINQKGEGEEEYPEINSRYSIVMATAKRARQLIAGEDQLVGRVPTTKPLSVAVEEVRRGKVKITEEGNDDFQFHLQSNDNNAAAVYEEESDSDVQETEEDMDESEGEDAE